MLKLKYFIIFLIISMLNLSYGYRNRREASWWANTRTASDSTQSISKDSIKEVDELFACYEKGCIEVREFTLSSNNTFKCEDAYVLIEFKISKEEIMKNEQGEKITVVKEVSGYFSPISTKVQWSQASTKCLRLRVFYLNAKSCLILFDETPFVVLKSELHSLIVKCFLSQFEIFNSIMFYFGYYDIQSNENQYLSLFRDILLGFFCLCSVILIAICFFCGCKLAFKKNERGEESDEKKNLEQAKTIEDIIGLVGTFNEKCNQFSNGQTENFNNQRIENQLMKISDFNSEMNNQSLVEAVKAINGKIDLLKTTAIKRNMKNK